MENTTKWISFTQENAGYALKNVCTAGGLTVFITDFRKLWRESLTNEQLHERFKVYNLCIN